MGIIEPALFAAPQIPIAVRTVIVSAYLSLYASGLGTDPTLALSGLYSASPFSLSNLFFPVDTSSGLSYQLPYLQIAPLLGVSGLYNQLFPYLFNPTGSDTTDTTT